MSLGTAIRSHIKICVIFKITSGRVTAFSLTTMTLEDFRVRPKPPRARLSAGDPAFWKMLLDRVWPARVEVTGDEGGPVTFAALAQRARDGGERAD